MKPLTRILPIIPTALLLAFLCGSNKSNGQGTNTPANETEALAAKDVNGAEANARRTDTVLLPDGSYYEGEIDAGDKFDGRGRLVAPNGTDQHGEWRHGEAYKLGGTWVAPDGTKEVGTWTRDGTKSGGTIRWPDGRKYEGEWQIAYGTAELPDGAGVMTWPDGRTYTGRFHNGEMDGLGKMTWPNGKVEDGSWQHGKFVGAKP